jgi:hypothetical protein
MFINCYRQGGGIVVIKMLKFLLHLQYKINKMKKILALLILVFGFTANQSVKAQVTQSAEIDTNTYVIIRNNGNEMIGKIISDDGREVLIQTETLGKIYVPKSDIRSIKKIDVSKDVVNGEYRARGPFTTRYQFTTNSFPIEKGENYALINLFGPEVHFAVSKNFSVGVITTWIASPIVLALKYSIPTNYEKINFGFGTLLGSTGYLNQGRGYGGLHWGMITLGDRKKNLTFSVGYSYAKVNIFNSGFYVEGNYPAIQDPSNPGNPTFNFNLPETKKPIGNAPIIGLGGIVSVGSKASFIFDSMILFGNQTNQYQNYVYNNQGMPSYTSIVNNKTKSTNLILMPGMRFQKSEDKAFQISLTGVIGSTDGERYSFPIPMCSWFYKF